MNLKGRKFFNLILVIVILLPFLFSCSNKTQKKSFLSALDEIDALINQKQYKQAIDELEMTEKTAFGSWNQLGVYKRYAALSENERAEKFLLKCIKKNPENLELLAVLSNFFVKNGKMEEALAYGKKLEGTNYGSIYSEIVLKNIVQKAENEGVKAVLDTEDFYTTFYDAYLGYKNNAWLRNCALMHLKKGNYESASLIKPQEIYDASDSYFWALVMYDSKRFGESVNYIEASHKLVQNKADKKMKNILVKDLYCLESDALTNLHDDEQAEIIRQEYLKTIIDEKNGWQIPDVINDESLAVVFCNSARWALDNQKEEDCKKLLSFCVNQWPDFVPCLTLYAHFAYISNLPEKSDFMIHELRDKGSTTLEMEKYDNRVIIPLSDAKNKIEKSILKNHDPILYIVDLDLKYKASNMSEKEKCIDLWNILEENMVSPSVYPDVLLDYALSFLLKHDEINDAWNLFYKDLSAKYCFEGDFWENLILKVHELSDMEKEYASYFAAKLNRKEDALLLHELSVFDENEYSENKLINSKATVSECVNLCAVYKAIGEEKDALDLYGKVSGRIANLSSKSLILYRMAEIYFDKSDYTNARRCVEYSLNLNKNNEKARFLLNKIKLLQEKCESKIVK